MLLRRRSPQASSGFGVLIGALALTLIVGASGVARAAAPAAGQPPASAATLPTPPLPAPPDPAARYAHCMALAHSNPAQAFTEAETWRQENGHFPAEHCAAVALIGLKRYAEAAARLEALAGAMMQESPRLRAETLEQAGQAWLLGNQAAKAKIAFDGALKLAPGNTDLLIDRAEAYAEEKKYWNAIDDLNQALEQEPDRADALVFRASAYRRLPDGLDLARTDVDRALKIAPDDVPALLERGNIRSLKGAFAGASAAWSRVERLAPRSPEAAAAKDNLARPATVQNSGAPAK